ncbi:HPr family phosphocarrier protein [Ammoniphilus sp. YIM 78166]|uniref:HPr family phosphocarrier protein n=1 Tax=Ammoniphilus sp. YIM 78166 TaxID=1644106 RepID=UPI00106F31EE|nr:HPr family phosphocarrier protein [Ammoniphilus sp. YIM 78166]
MKVTKAIINLSEDRTILELSQILAQFSSVVIVKKYEGAFYKEANLKSILGLISLRLKNGDQITIEGTGEDEEQAVQAVATFLSGGA